MIKEAAKIKEVSLSGVIVKRMTKFSDQRGWLSECFRHDEISKDIYPAMSYITVTHPGMTRGPHEHLRQTDYFYFPGYSEFKLYLWDNRKASHSFGKKTTIVIKEDNPTIVIVPPGVVHAIKNTGREKGLVINYPNKLFAGWDRKKQVDEIRYEDDSNSAFQVESDSVFTNLREKNKRKKMFVTGAYGLLGSDMVKILSRDHEVIGTDKDTLDITKKDDVEQMIRVIRPDVVINCAAWVDADSAELNKEEVFLINAEGVKNLAEACKDVRAKLVHFTSDYIFDGEKNEPYDESDQPNPLNVYGHSKVKAEKYILDILDDYIIVRTQWLFGQNGKNFVRTILRLASEKDELRIVNDQIGSPTYTEDLVRAIEQLILKDARGIFNITNSGYCSWYEFTRKILKLSDVNHVKITPISSEELDWPARRPKHSILDKSKFYMTTHYKMPHFEKSLKDYLDKAAVKNKVLS